MKKKSDLMWYINYYAALQPDFSVNSFWQELAEREFDSRISRRHAPEREFDSRISRRQELDDGNFPDLHVDFIQRMKGEYDLSNIAVEGIDDLELKSPFVDDLKLKFPVIAGSE